LSLGMLGSAMDLTQAAPEWLLRTGDAPGSGCRDLCGCRPAFLWIEWNERFQTSGSFTPRKIRAAEYDLESEGPKVRHQFAGVRRRIEPRWERTPLEATAAGDEGSGRPPFPLWKRTRFAAVGVCGTKGRSRCLCSGRRRGCQPRRQGRNGGVVARFMCDFRFDESWARLLTGGRQAIPGVSSPAWFESRSTRSMGCAVRFSRFCSAERQRNRDTLDGRFKRARQSPPPPPIARGWQNARPMHDHGGSERHRSRPSSHRPEPGRRTGGGTGQSPRPAPCPAISGAPRPQERVLAVPASAAAAEPAARVPLRDPFLVCPLPREGADNEGAGLRKSASPGNLTASARIQSFGKR